MSTGTVAGSREVELASDGAGRWTVDGRPRRDLDGLIDIDLEASACTNTFPVHRLDLPVGEPVRAPTVYVPALDGLRPTPRPDVPTDRRPPLPLHVRGWFRGRSPL